MLDEGWVFHENTEAVKAGEGVVRRVLVYSKDLMCVKNTFEKGMVGSLYHYPHAQITYTVSGESEFNIEGEKRIVKAGNTTLEMDGVEHDCACLEAGILLDISTPMREDFMRPISCIICKLRVPCTENAPSRGVYLDCARRLGRSILPLLHVYAGDSYFSVWGSRPLRSRFFSSLRLNGIRR